MTNKHLTEPAKSAADFDGKPSYIDDVPNTNAGRDEYIEISAYLRGEAYDLDDDPAKPEKRI